ncbi:MAG: 4-hydroxy-4-methyl-2-oxoglutarate aldolase [Gaiellales bacterium]|jgi:regulator of RNase E activity RraA|nr:4-hydroxy-4-methyl-2-oxoglutarate aldolase [Gaiellales bacterium]
MPHDLALIDRLAALHPAVVSDCLDSLGHRDQVMAPAIRPLATDMRLAGVAATVRCVAVDGVPDDHSEWHRGTIEAVDALEPGDVLVASTCEAAFWGELLATASRRRGARGVVADAYARDTLELIDMGFATFARGIYCADALGRIRVDAADVPIECGGVTVHSGDLVLADHDGVVVLPAAVAEEAIRLAEAKVGGENHVRDALAGGMSVAEAFRTFGLL